MKRLLLTIAAAGFAALAACSDWEPGVRALADSGEGARVRLLTHAETLQSVQHGAGGADAKADTDAEAGSPADLTETPRAARRTSGLED